MTKLQLNYPVNFVIPEAHLWDDIRTGNIDGIDAEKLAGYAVDSRNCWIGRTYFHLQQAGAEVTHAPRPRRAAINVVAPRDFGRRDRHPDDFIVVPRADSHRPMLANYTLVQCAAAPVNDTTSYMSHWPQADIRPRDHAARPGVERLVFKGRMANLAAPFRSQSFIDRLSAMGVRLVVDALSEQTGPKDWGNYADSDVTLAVRDKTHRDAMLKPPSKLINAWFGETPAILGPEPAYQSLRQSELDYIEVTTPDAVIAALQKMRAEPAFFQAMIDNGRQRRAGFTVAQITLEWAQVFNTRIGPLFEQWQRKSAAEKRLRWAAMMIQEPISKRHYHYTARHGARLLESGAQG